MNLFCLPRIINCELIQEFYNHECDSCGWQNKTELIELQWDDSYPESRPDCLVGHAKKGLKDSTS